MDTEVYDEFDGGPEGNDWDIDIPPPGEDGNGNQGGNSPDQLGGESDGESEDEWLKKVDTLKKKKVTGPVVSDYELQRQKNILRNKEMLAELANDWDDFDKRMKKGKVLKPKKTRAPRKRPVKGTKATRSSSRNSGPPPPSNPSVLAPASSSPLPLTSPQPSPSTTLAVATGSLVSSPAQTSLSIPTWLENALSELRFIKGPPGWTELVDALWLLDLSLGYPTGKVCPSVFLIIFAL
jgi:hypothetical protein